MAVFTIDETMRGVPIGPASGGYLTRIEVTNRGGSRYIMPQRTLRGDFWAGGHLQLRPDTPGARDLWCCDLSTTPLGGSVGGGFGSTLMSGAVRYEGQLIVVHCPPLPASFSITIEDSFPRDPPAPRRSKHNTTPKPKPKAKVGAG